MSRNPAHQWPAAELKDGIKGAFQGVDQPFTDSWFMGRLGLNGEASDYRPFMSRLTGGDHGVSGLRAVVELAPYLVRLVARANERTATPAEENIMGLLGSVMARHVRREGTACDGAAVLLQQVGRPDLIPGDVRASIHVPMEPASGTSGLWLPTRYY